MKYLILYPPFENSTTRIAITYTAFHKFRGSEKLTESKYIYTFRSRDQSPTRRLNFAELERVVSSQEKTSKYHTSGLEREQICQNYEDLRDILATIKMIYNETKNYLDTETTDNGLMSLRSFRLIEELQRMFNETKSSQMPENAKEKSEEKKNPTLEKPKVNC